MRQRLVKILRRGIAELPTILPTIAVGVALAFSFVETAQAYGGSAPAFLSQATQQVCSAYTGVKQIVFIGGGAGLVALSTAAFFGRFKWGHLAALAGGLGLLGGASQAVSWIANNSSTACQL